MPKQRRIVLRTDGGPEIGLGHVVRCMALAQAFAARGHQCRFAGSAPPFLAPAIPGGPPAPVADDAWSDGAFCNLVDGADLLVTDLYAIGETWQRRSPRPVLAIADPPLRPQHCALLVLPTSFEQPVTGNALLAPEHCLLRREIVEARTAPKDGTRLLVSCGGGKDAGLTVRVVEAIASDPALSRLPVTIVLGVGDDGRKAVLARLLGGLRDARILEEVADMAALMREHDIAVGAPGGSALERACMGLAQVLVPIADNQQALGAGLAGRGAALMLEPGATVHDIAAALRRLVDDDRLRRVMAETAFTLVDGKGAARVVQAVEREIFA